jgi:hypothetical protein
LFLFFPRSYGTGAPFLAELAQARQDFFSFLKNFPSRLQALRDISTRNWLWKNAFALR